MAIIAAVAAGIIFHDLRLLPSMQAISLRDTASSYSPCHLPANGPKAYTERFWRVYLWFLTCALCLLAGLRYNVGLDTIVSQEGMEYVPLLSDLSADDLRRDAGGRFMPVYSMLKTLGVGLWPWQTLNAVILNVAFVAVTVRYTQLWFVALGCWLMFGYITLDFETMLAGTAAGCLLAGVPDLQNGRYGRFYLKLCLGAFFHLSVLLMAWLPILTTRPARRITASIPGLAALFLAMPLLAWGIKQAIVGGCTVFDRFPCLDFLGLSSENILRYGEELLQSARLNWKGYLGVGFRDVVMPLGAALLLLYTKRQPAEREKTFGLLLLAFALIETMRFETIAAGRLSMLLLPTVAIGLAMALEACRTMWLKTAWWLTVGVSSVVALHSFWTPMPLTGQGRRIEIYYPYCSWLDRGIVYRRAWLAMNYNRLYSRTPKETWPIYDFTFELKPGEHEVASPFHPEQTHAAMERVRLRLCPADSTAPALPLGTVMRHRP